jgi:hypothetical protein
VSFVGRSGGEVQRDGCGAAGERAQALLRASRRTQPAAWRAVRALQDWLKLAGIGEGPVFRPINRHEQLSDKRLTDFAVAVIIKRAAKKAGMPTPQLSGHSLRGGFVTEAKKNGADDAAIMDQDFGWLHAVRQPDGSTIAEMKVHQAPACSGFSGSLECEGWFYRNFDEGTTIDHTDIITPDTWCEIDHAGSSTVSVCQWPFDYYPVALDMACDCRYPMR